MTIHSRFCELAEKTGIQNPQAYSSQQLKQHLIKKYREFLFIQQNEKICFALLISQLNKIYKELIS